MATEADETTSVPLALYSAALDEIWHLRRALAFEARCVEAQTLDLKALGKRRRERLVTAIGRMRDAADGEVRKAYAGCASFSLRNEYQRVTGRQTLTRHQWEYESLAALAAARAAVAARDTEEGT